MTRRDLLHQLAEASVDLGPLLVSVPVTHQLTQLCATARTVFGAAAASIAVVRGADLHYVAAAGAGADEIVGTVVPDGRGIGGYVAGTGQAIVIDRPADDPRFAKDVAERTGHVPASILAVPVAGPGGDPVGVLTVLDRTAAVGDALAVAGSFADLAATLVPALEATARGARLLLDTVIDAVRSGDAELAAALERAVVRLPDEDADLAATAAALERLRHVDAATRRRVNAVVAGTVDLATSSRRR